MIEAYFMIFGPVLGTTIIVLGVLMGIGFSRMTDDFLDANRYNAGKYREQKRQDDEAPKPQARRIFWD